MITMEDEIKANQQEIEGLIKDKRGLKDQIENQRRTLDAYRDRIDHLEKIIETAVGVLNEEDTLALDPSFVTWSDDGGDVSGIQVLGIDYAADVDKTVYISNAKAASDWVEEPGPADTFILVGDPSGAFTIKELDS